MIGPPAASDAPSGSAAGVAPGAGSVGLNPSLHAFTANVTRSIRAIRRMMSSCGLLGRVSRATTVFRQSVLFGNDVAGWFRCGRPRVVPCWDWEATLAPVPRVRPSWRALRP
jgi:hypothetical protein